MLSVKNDLTRYCQELKDLDDYREEFDEFDYK